MRLTEKDISVRELTQADAAVLLRWLTDDRVLEWYEGRDAGFTPEKIQEHFYADDAAVNRCIVEYEGKPVGYVQYYPLDADGLEEYAYTAQTADTGPAHSVYAMDQFLGEPDCWGRGIGRQFIGLLLSYLTRECGAKTVLLDPHADNNRAIRCYEACGFHRVKLLSAHELHEGTWRDCVLMEYGVAAP